MSNVQTIDCHYLGRPNFAAAFLIIEGDRAAFVENNTTHAVPLLLAALERAGLEREQVEYALVTHVHLDHAGGSSALLEACPNATLVAHPRAARHLIDPSRLVASASEVYGKDEFRKMYGEIRAIPEARVRTASDGERLRFGTRELTFFHTRGHANHHLCIHDSGSDGIFTGDAFGLVYPALQHQGTFAFPTTSPTDFDPDEARAVVRQIAGWGAKRVFLTHFGEHEDVSGIATQLLADLDFSADLYDQVANASLTPAEREERCRTELRKRFEERLVARGITPDAAVWDLLALDLDLNAQGIAFAAGRKNLGARKTGR